VLQDAGFSVHEGEVLGLIGPNGAGKTTLFECLASLLPTDGGSVEFRGEALPAGHRKQALFYLPDGIRPWADPSNGSSRSSKQFMAGHRAVRRFHCRSAIALPSVMRRISQCPLFIGL
jgi:ABC-type branched-subunit amino acid transport system ATPase component